MKYICHQKDEFIHIAPIIYAKYIYFVRTQALQQYVDSMERDLDSEIDPDEEDDAGEVETQMQQVQDDEDIMTVERLSVPPVSFFY